MAKLIFQTLTQEFEDDNIFDFDKSPEDFLQNISEEWYDLRHNFPSIDDFSQIQKQKENDFRKSEDEFSFKIEISNEDNFEEEKSVVCNTIIGLSAGANNPTDFTLKTPKSVFESKE